MTTTRIAIYGAMLIKEIEAHFPALLGADFDHGEVIMFAQVAQESGWNPDAKSPVGACGLLQLMLGTDKEIDGDYDGADPQGNLDNGVRYLAWLYSKFGEIPDPQQRICFALAAYNGGRGYINKALELGRIYDGWPGSYDAWVRDDRPNGRWQTWQFASTFLADPRCEVGGKRPDHKQIISYVSAICQHASKLLREVYP